MFDNKLMFSTNGDSKYKGSGYYSGVSEYSMKFESKAKEVSNLMQEQMKIDEDASDFALLIAINSKGISGAKDLTDKVIS